MAYVREDFITKNTREKHYIDITTRLINSGVTGVKGNNRNFRANIQAMSLDPNRHYTIKVASIRYRNVNLGDNVYMTVLSSLGENIRINNTNSSVLFQSNIPASDANHYYRDGTNNWQFELNLSDRIISTVQIELVRSDNGEPWPIDPSDNADATSITLEITAH